MTSQQQGVLGPAQHASQLAQQAFLAPGRYQATEVPTFFNTLSLQPPDSNWCMDTGATSHLRNNSCITSSIVNWHAFNSHILVGGGSKIPVKSSGTSFFPDSTPPFTLKNILYAPKINKNLISVHQFTIDNCVSIEFDPFGS